MNDPTRRRQIETADDDFHVSEEARRHNDPTKQVDGAYDDPGEAIRDVRSPRGDNESIFELEGDVVTSDDVPTQPSHDGIGPFTTPVIIVVAALVILIILLVLFT
jgi:hypothetical protein